MASTANSPTGTEDTVFTMPPNKGVELDTEKGQETAVAGTSQYSLQSICSRSAEY